MTSFANQKVLVTGGTGMIGIPLVARLKELGAEVLVVSLDEGEGLPAGVQHIRGDLRDRELCLTACAGVHSVFHLAGVKGSPKMTREKPASFMVPTLQFSLNVMEAARLSGVERFLLTSSVGVYAPANVFREDSMWDEDPSPHDRFAGWAKRMTELQAEAYAIEFGWNAVSIVRPANVYGPWDNFDLRNSMVIPSLIRRVMDGEDPLRVWGDGTPRRDFLFAEDCAKMMIEVMESGVTEPVNLGSGVGVSIGEVVELVLKSSARSPTVIWDESADRGDDIRIMDVARADSLGIRARTSLSDGIQATTEWFGKWRAHLPHRYNSFLEYE